MRNIIANRKILIFWLLCVISFLYQYGIRVAIPGVLNDNIQYYFSIGSQQLGILVSCAYIVYMCMQIPVGFIIDKYNISIIALASCFITSLSIISFATANCFSYAMLSQLVLGCSSAFAFSMVVKVATNCFSKHYLTIATSIGMALGGIGPITIGIIIAYFSKTHSWHHIIVGIGIAGIFISFMLGISGYFMNKSISVLNNSVSNVAFSYKNRLKNKISVISLLKNTFSNINFVLVCLCATFIFGTTSAFSDTWGISFIQKMHDIDKITATSCVSMQFIGTTFGGPFFALLAKYFNSFKKAMLIGSTFLIIIITIITFIKTNIFTLRLLIFFLGICGSTQSLSFLFALHIFSNTQSISGSITGIVNTMTMFGSSIMIFVVGYMIDRSSQAISKVSHYVYTVSDYQNGMICLIISATIATAIILCIKDAAISSE